MTEAVPQPEPVSTDAAEGRAGVEGDDAWPQLSELDLDVCLSATLRDRRQTAPPSAPDQKP